jgi:hypothetical protein
VLGAYAEDELEGAVEALTDKPHPADWADAEAYPVTTVIASTLDRRADLVQNGRLIAEGKLSVDAPAGLGSHVLILKGASGAPGASRGLTWQAISHHDRPGAAVGDRLSGDDIAARLRAERGFRNKLRRHMHPGMVMVVTDVALHPDRRSDTDFVIMSSA